MVFFTFSNLHDHPRSRRYVYLRIYRLKITIQASLNTSHRFKDKVISFFSPFLLADVDSTAHDLLHDQQNKSVDGNKTTSTTPLTESRPSTTSPPSHLYLRGTSHILTTPPNPLASNDHPDNQLTVGNNFPKTFSPIHSAGFELTSNNSVQISSSSAAAAARTTFFTFDTSVLEQNGLKSHLNEENKDDKQENMAKSLLMKPDERTNSISTNGLSQDENSNHSSTNSSGHNTSSRTLCQILQTSSGKKFSFSLNIIRFAILRENSIKFFFITIIQ